MAPIKLWTCMQAALRLLVICCRSNLFAPIIIPQFAACLHSKFQLSQFGMDGMESAAGVLTINSRFNSLWGKALPMATKHKVYPEQSR
jgi:hypothetical protein